MKDSVHIREGKASDASAIQALANKSLGDGYFKISTNEAILVADTGSRVIGFVCGS
jgi:hypothetical protein